MAAEGRARASSWRRCGGVASVLAPAVDACCTAGRAVLGGRPAGRSSSSRTRAARAAVRLRGERAAVGVQGRLRVGLRRTRWVRGATSAPPASRRALDGAWAARCTRPEAGSTADRAPSAGSRGRARRRARSPSRGAGPTTPSSCSPSSATGVPVERGPSAPGRACASPPRGEGGRRPGAPDANRRWLSRGARPTDDLRTTTAPRRASWARPRCSPVPNSQAYDGPRRPRGRARRARPALDGGRASSARACCARRRLVAGRSAVPRGRGGSPGAAAISRACRLEPRRASPSPLGLAALSRLA